MNFRSLLSNAYTSLITETDYEIKFVEYETLQALKVIANHLNYSRIILPIDNDIYGYDVDIEKISRELGFKTTSIFYKILEIYIDCSIRLMEIPDIKVKILNKQYENISYSILNKTDAVIEICGMELNAKIVEDRIFIAEDDINIFNLSKEQIPEFLNNVNLGMYNAGFKLFLITISDRFDDIGSLKETGYLLTRQV